MPATTHSERRTSHWGRGLCVAVGLFLLVGLCRLAYPAYRAPQLVAQLTERGYAVETIALLGEEWPNWVRQPLENSFIQCVIIADDDVDSTLNHDGDLRRVAELIGLTYYGGGILDGSSLYLNIVSDKDLAHLGGLPQLQSLSLAGEEVTDAGVKQLRGLKNLARLDVYSQQITNEGLGHIVKFAKLRDLRLNSPHITDAGLKHLQSLSNLETLGLRDARITDIKLTELTALRSLRSLRLAGTGISDPGLKTLSTLTSLTTLMVNDTRVTDAGLAHVARLSNLAYLDVSRTQVTDAGLNHLQKLKQLTNLQLTDTKVTNSGLRQLLRFENLRQVDLRGTQVTDEAIKMAKTIFPNLVFGQNYPICF